MKPNMSLSLEALAIHQLKRRQQVEPTTTEPFDFVLMVLLALCFASWSAVITLIALAV